MPVASSSGVDWNAVSAVAGAIAAIAAAVAVGLTVVGAREQRKQRRNDRRTAHYDKWISVPAMAAMRAYSEEVKGLLKAKTKEVSALASFDPSHQAVLQAVNTLVRDCDNHYYKLQGTLTVSAEAWDDGSLRDSLYEAASKLQDDVNLAINALTANSDIPDFDAIVNRGAASIIKLVLDHDPGAENA